MRSYHYISPEEKNERAKHAALTCLHQVRKFAEINDFGADFAAKVNGCDIGGVTMSSLQNLVSDFIDSTTESEALRVLKTNWDEIDGFILIAGMEEKLRKAAYKELKGSLTSPFVSAATKASRPTAQPI